MNLQEEEFDEKDFKITEIKNISNNLKVAYCAIRKGSSSRWWGYCMSTPSCLVKYTTSKEGTERFVLGPDYYNQYQGSDFETFLDHIERCSGRVCDVFKKRGMDVSLWKSPVKKSSDEVVEGLIVKVRQPVLVERLKSVSIPVRCVLKLSCVYFCPERSGVTFEVIDMCIL